MCLLVSNVISLQDSLGIQGKRVAVQKPLNDTLTALVYDNIAIAGKCVYSGSVNNVAEL